MKKIYLFFFIISIWNCASTSTVTLGANTPKVIKKEGFNSNTKRVSTLNVFNLETKKFASKTDPTIMAIGSTVDAKISEIYGEGIVGGDAILELADKLKLTNFEKAVQNFIESELSSTSFSIDSQKTLNTIVEKGKIDALAFPIVNGGSEKLQRGENLEIIVIIYDGKSGKTQILASHNVKAKAEDLTLMQAQPDQAKANMTRSALEKTTELMSALGKEVNPSKPSDVKKEEKVTSSESKEEKPEEPLKPFDDWLVSKIKVGLGPIVMGFLGVLFFVL